MILSYRGVIKPEEENSEKVTRTRVITIKRFSFVRGARKKLKDLSC